MKFKKFIAILLTAITAACIAVGFSGCKEEIKLPPMTAEAPEVEDSFYGYYVYSKNMNYQKFDYYYNNEFKQVYDKKFYFISTELVEPEVQGRFYMGERINIFAKKDSETENNLVNPIINCDGSVTDNDLGIYRKKGPISPETLEFKAYFISLEEETEDYQLILKFGNLSGTHYYSYYINMYKGDICIGTVYFHTEVSIPQEWFENIFTKHLVYGG